jgi:tRNA uridine 5-carbamoylmethylation protein Kti12
MDGRADEAIVAGGEDEAEDVIGLNSATTIRRTTSLPLSKKRYKKLGIPLLQGNTLILVVQNKRVIVGSQNFIPQVRLRLFLGLDSPLVTG